MCNLNPILEKHSFFDSPYSKKRALEITPGNALHSSKFGAAGTLLGLGVGEITGRLASRDKEGRKLTPEEKKKIRNKHRLIGAGLGFAGGFVPIFGLNAYSNASSSMGLSRTMARSSISRIKYCMSRINQERESLKDLRSLYNKRLKKYEEIIAGNNSPLPNERDYYEKVIKDYQEWINNAENRIRDLKADIKEEKEEISKYFDLRNPGSKNH